MHKPTPIDPHGYRHIFHSEPTICDNDSAMSVSSQPPIFLAGTSHRVSFRLFPPPGGEHEEHISGGGLPSQRVSRHTPCPRTDVGVESPLAGVLQQHCPRSSPATSHHAHSPRLRLSIAGFHARLQECCALSHFFPRSVGLGPTVSRANGAFTVAPSMLCHAQAIPSISLYSASPRRHIRTKTPARFHSRKYLCTELALPYSFGRAFHWQPVRRTYTIASKTFLCSMGLRPPPGFLLYFFPFSRFFLGIRGETLFHSSSETVHDFIALMLSILLWIPSRCQYYLRISS